MKRPLKILSVALCFMLALLILPAGNIKADAASIGRTAGVIAVSRGGLNVRSSPTTSSSVKKVMLKGEYITLISKEGNWWYVQYSADGYGYCSADYIAQQSGSYEAYVATSSGRLNVRSGPSTGYSVKATLAKGSKVVVLSQSGDFYKVLYNGRYVGWASKKYIKAKETQGAAGIALSVPKYYQYESRWASVEVGDSGRDIGDIGCTLTCLAMTESYRTGTTITPKEMESRLRFTSSGALYWPSNYVLYSGSDPYTQILTALKSGKPVIYGGRTSSGATHWVVITGFKGGDAVPANFTIHDPA
ncbi:MAG: SH3 domain-containing protein, partial [Clostridia bacterium]|nr:SH3 domain-containing protein [Clostridia bacterium]